MAAMNRSSTFGPLSGAGSAGPRRLALMGGVAVIALGAIGFMIMRGHHHPQTASVASLPDVNALPGGMRSNAYYNNLATQQAQQAASAAASNGQSSVAPMPAGVPAQPATTAPVVAVAQTAPTVKPIQPAHLMTPTPVVYASPPAVHSDPSPSPENKQQSQAYAAAVGSLMAGWGNGPSPATQVYIDPAKDPVNGASGQNGAVAQSLGQGGNGAVPSGSQGNSASAGPTAQAAVLIPAGKGVYARTKLEADSDTGGPVVVTAESGPIAGDDMTGTFTRHGDRLVVELTSITLPDGSQQTIDALLIAPDSMETAVASSVDEHYVSRFVLPVAAAFVAGLGQAIEQSNATVAVSPLGGYTSQNNLNFNQQLGVAAGAAGSQLQKLFLENAPNGPTVKLATGANVGVVFLKPLTQSAAP